MKTLLLLLTILSATLAQPAKFHVIRQWKYINFTWPTDDAFQSAVSKGLYVPDNVLMAGVKYFEDFFYITLPRMKRGVPATLARIRAGSPEASPRLEPFPSWEMNEVGECANLQNVQNVEIDTKGQMWIIDGGRVDTLTDSVVKCSPKLVIFDIRGNRVGRVFVFPEEQASKATSFLYDIVVDSTDGGYAYITDNSGQDPGMFEVLLKSLVILMRH